MTDEDNLSQPLFVHGRYENPWPTWKKITLYGAVKLFLFEEDNRNVPRSTEKLNDVLPVIPMRSEDFSSESSGVRLAWIGHASVLFQFDGITILTDPVFSSRIGPSYMKVLKRYREAACTIEQLPKIDAVVISHNHYDHLDLESVIRLNERFGDELAWFVPAGMADWMHQCGIKTVTELSWWESGSKPGCDNVEFVCTPAQHWSKRGMFDDNRALWCSWSVIGPNHRVFFNGDTGYCSAYKEIGKMYGPFDVAAIPIGAYKPKHMLGPQHVDPEQAVMIHKDIRSKKSLGIHWGTFSLGREFYLEPPQKFADAAKASDIEPEDCFVLKHGEVKEIL